MKTVARRFFSPLERLGLFQLLAIGFLGSLLCVLPAIAQKTAPISSSSGACGPPNYCARTDRRVEPYPKTPPLIGSAGSIITDPTFGSRIVRVTDAKTDPSGLGRPLMTASGANENAWNATSTVFYVMNNGGTFLLFDFNPSTLAVHLRGAPELKWRGEPQFSYTQANTLYGIGWPQPGIEQYDISTGKTRVLDDPSKCFAMKFSDKVFALSVSGDDNRFTTIIGPEQDRNYVILVYDREKGCRWYNTETGEIGGQWGPKGTTSIGERYGVHGARISESGNFVMISPGAGAPGPRKWRIWNVETLNVTVCPAKCGGHQTMGYSHILNPGGNHPLAIVKRPLDRLDSLSPMVSDLSGSPGYWYDLHLSWTNVNPDDSNPACLSTYRPSNPSTPGTPLDVSGPWENEVLCVETDGKASKLWRFAHTYSTAKNGFYSQPRGNVSPDSRFFMFTSDWEDQLGKTASDKYRTDVFIVELR